MHGDRALGASFWGLWTTSTAANLGDGVRGVAFPLLAVSLTRDPVLVSAVAAATTLPWLVVGPFAGVAVDRFDRLRLLWAVNAARAAVVIALTVAVATDHATIWLLVGAALLVGAGETFVDDAAQSLVPRTVRPAQLERANARLYGAQVVTGQFLGRGLTGLLFAAAVVAPFVLDAAMLLAAALVALVLAVRARPRDGSVGRRAAGAAAARREDRVNASQPTAPRAPALGIADGARWLLTQPLLRGLWVMLASLGFASGAFWGVIALYATGRLGLGPTGFGFVLAVGAAGSLVGSHLAPAVRDRLGTASAIHLAVALVVVSVLGLALTSSGVVAAALMVTNGVGVLIWNVLGVSLRQRLVPDALLGRVNAAFSTVAVGAASLGALSAGLIATALGLPAVFWMSGALVAVVALLTAPTLRGGCSRADSPSSS